MNIQKVLASGQGCSLDEHLLAVDDIEALLRLDQALAVQVVNCRIVICPIVQFIDSRGDAALVEHEGEGFDAALADGPYLKEYYIHVAQTKNSSPQRVSRSPTPL